MVILPRQRPRRWGRRFSWWYGWSLHEQAAAQRRAKEWLRRTSAISRITPAPPVRRGDVIGELDIPRLRLSLMVFEGDDAGILIQGAGHIPPQFTVCRRNDPSERTRAGRPHSPLIHHRIVMRRWPLRFVPLRRSPHSRPPATSESRRIATLTSAPYAPFMRTTSLS